MMNNLIKVAYADDHDAVREGIANLISEQGTISFPIKARNGADLIAQLETAHELPDICIIDINMPEKNGFETQIELAKRWPKIKTLVLTAHDPELYIIKMIMAGAKGYLLKSCSPSELEEAIISIYRDGIYHSDMAGSRLYYDVKNERIKLPNLTEKEMEVLKYSCSDLSYEEIASIMGTTRRSVEGHRDSLFKKLHVNSRTMLALCSIQLGLVPMLINETFNIRTELNK